MLDREITLHDADNALRLEAYALHTRALGSTDYTVNIKLLNEAMLKLHAMAKLTDDDYSLLARCDNNIAYALEHMGLHREALIAYHSATKAWRHITNPTDKHLNELVFIMQNICGIYAVLSQCDDELHSTFADYCADALNQYEQKLDQLNNQHLYLLGSLHFYLAFYGSDQQRGAVESFQNAIAYLTSIRDKTFLPDRLGVLIGLSFHYIGTLYVSIGATRLAIPQLHKAVAYFPKQATDDIKALMKSNTALLQQLQSDNKYSLQNNVNAFFTGKQSTAIPEKFHIARPRYMEP